MFIDRMKLEAESKCRETEYIKSKHSELYTSLHKRKTK